MKADEPRGITQNKVTDNFRKIRGLHNIERKIRTSKNKNNLTKHFLQMENSCVTNLASYELNCHELAILNKGLNFIYTNNYTDHTEENMELIDNFERKLQIKLFFDKNAERGNKIKTQDGLLDNNDNKDNKTKIENIKISTNWYPPNPNTAVNTFCNKLKYEIKHIYQKHKNIPNINKSELIALNKLRNNKEILLKAADKGGGIVVMNTKDYEEKMITHLESNSTYLKTTEELFLQEDLLTKYKLLIIELKPYLSKKQFHWISDVKNELGIIYGLPKIHKAGNPLRPIISQCNSLTNKLHTYLQQVLKIGEAQIPNLIKDSTDFLNKLKKQNHRIKNDTILVTLDVESLYTNIPLESGIDWIVEHYTKTLKDWKRYVIDIKPIPAALLKRILEFTLRNCYFTFNGAIYQQIQGLTMGGGSSVQNANIIMYKFFQKFHKENPKNVWAHDRFIDDLFGIWNRTLDDLNKYFRILNNFHPNFKFTLNQSTTEIPFLDVNVIKINGGLQTTIYTKPTDKKLYLNFASCHPPHTKRSIPFSQFLRLKRIVSDPTDLIIKANNMAESFKLRNYPETILNGALLKLRQIDRDTLFNYNTKTKIIVRPILVLIYENKYEKNNLLKRTLYKLWHQLIEECPEAHRYLKQKPMLAYKNGKSIKKTLISSKYPAPWQKKPESQHNLDQLDKENILNLISLMLD